MYARAHARTKFIVKTQKEEKLIFGRRMVLYCIVLNMNFLERKSFSCYFGYVFTIEL